MRVSNRIIHPSDIGLIIIHTGDSCLCTACGKSTPQKSSWIVSGVFEWTFSGIFKRNFTCQWYVPKDCHLSSGLSLELSDGLPVAYSNICSLVWFLACNLLPRPVCSAALRTRVTLPWARCPTFGRTPYFIITISIIINIHVIGYLFAYAFTASLYYVLLLVRLVFACFTSRSRTIGTGLMGTWLNGYLVLQGNIPLRASQSMHILKLLARQILGTGSAKYPFRLAGAETTAPGPWTRMSPSHRRGTLKGVPRKAYF